jgi:DNA-binding NtrC family response regulator
MITAFGSVKSAVEAMKMGADDYVTKPFDSAEILEKLPAFAACADIVHFPRRNGLLSPPPVDQSGRGQAMKELKAKIVKVKNNDATILITGESVCGVTVKTWWPVPTMIPEAEHLEPFVHVNCCEQSLPDQPDRKRIVRTEEVGFFGGPSYKKGEIF